MVIYRPQRGMLDDAMSEAKEFNSTDEMKQYITQSWHCMGEDLFTESDIIISGDPFLEERIGWKDTRHVCTKRMGKDNYDVPQCIGYCASEYDII